MKILKIVAAESLIAKDGSIAKDSCSSLLFSSSLLVEIHPEVEICAKLGSLPYLASYNLLSDHLAISHDSDIVPGSSSGHQTRTTTLGLGYP